MTFENIRVHVQTELARAKALRTAAQVEAQSGLYDRAATSLYFAAVHACRALLATKEIEPRSHRALRTLVSLHFGKTNLVDSRLPSALGDLQEAREGSDYVAAYTVSRDEYERLRDLADLVLREAERIAVA